MATGIQCISVSVDLSKVDKSNNVMVKKATKGRNTILSMLSFRALHMFVYFLPYRKTPSIKMATVEVVLPSMCRGCDIGVGISILMSENRMPEKIDRISGFFESLFATSFNPVSILDCWRRYNSRVVIEAVTLTIDIDAAANVAKGSPVPGKANVMKGIPKKAKLPKIVLRTSR